MLAVLLKILAVIGKILLWILAVILILLLIILLCPFGYKATVKKDRNDIRAGGSANWLLHIIHVSGSFARTGNSNQINYEIYLFGIPLMKLRNKLKGKKKTGDESAGGPEPAPAEASGIPGAPEEVTVTLPGESAEGSEDIFDSSDQDAAQGESQDTALKTGTVEAGREIRTEAPRKPSVEPGRWKYNPTEETEKKAEEIEIEVVPANRPGPFLQAAARFGAAVGKVRKICIKLDQMYYRLEDWLDYVDTFTFQKAKACILKNLFSIIRQILPRRVSGTLEFGTGDPASTGEALAALGALYAFLPERLSVIPDFDEAKADADVTIKGHFSIGGLLLRLIFIIVNPNIWTLIRVIKNKDPGIGTGKTKKKKKKKKAAGKAGGEDRNKKEKAA